MQYINKTGLNSNDRYFRKIACSKLEIADKFCSVMYESNEAPESKNQDPSAANVGLIGFASDMGASRCNEATGAAASVTKILEHLAQIAAPSELLLSDWGVISALGAKAIACTDSRMPQNPSSPGFVAQGCLDASLENADYALFLAASKVLESQSLFVLGGGAESCFAPICALANKLAAQKPGAHLGIISIAQFLGVRQQAAHTNANSLALAHTYARSQGLNAKLLNIAGCAQSNTLSSFRSLAAMSASSISDVQIEQKNFTELDKIIENSDALFLDVNLNAINGFNGCEFAATMGISMSTLALVLNKIFESKKLLAASLSECNDNFASISDYRLAARLSAWLIEGLSGLNIK